MPSPPAYDAFLSYNSLDHAIVERVAKELGTRHCKCFVDRWYLQPGRDWVDALERALSGSRSVAMFIGPREMGRWQQRERAWALDQLAGRSDFPVIPVLLPGCEPPLGFMKQLMWIDLRNDPADPVQLDALAAAIRGETVERDGKPEPRAKICPYRGLLAFREEDADFFFGRNTYTDDLVELVQRHPIVAVTGASGSGKSSVVRAGLVPRLRRQVGGDVWDIVTMFPRENPLHSLADVFLPLVEPELSGIDLLVKCNETAEHLANSRLHLWQLAKSGLEKQQGTNRLLLVVDQWEELYTTCRNEDQRNRFIDELLDATSRDRSPLSVVFTVRWDFYGEILKNRSLLDRLQYRQQDRLQHSRLDLGPMNRDELRCVIEEPASKVGLTFDDGLVRDLLDHAGDQLGSLPLLEFLLEELWKCRRGDGQMTQSAYDRLGGLKGAIANRAEAIFLKFNEEEQSAAESLFHRLVQAGSKTEEDTRRRADLNSLDETSRAVARKLADERLLVTTRVETAAAAPGNVASTAETVEVSHEELLRRWDRLRNWIDTDRQFLQWRSRLVPLLNEYERDPTFALLRGNALIEARQFFASRSAELDERERNFVVASETSARRLEWQFSLDRIPYAVAGEEESLFAALRRWTQEEPQQLERDVKSRIERSAQHGAIRNRYLATAVGLGLTSLMAPGCKLQNDPSLRTSFIHGFRDFPGDLKYVAETLGDRSLAPELRSALCVAIGRIGRDASDATRDVLERLYVEAPDGGTHGAARWALIQQGVAEGQLEDLIGKQLGSDAARDWYVGSAHGITMLKVPAGRYAIGDVTDDKNPTEEDEPIDFPAVWMSDRQISVAQFEPIMPELKDNSKQHGATVEMDLLRPVTEVTWFDAIAFCNRLSSQEQLKPYYTMNEAKAERKDGHIVGVEVSIVDEKGHGYRLPTEAEWEYACRAMSSMDYCYGDSVAFLPEYAVFQLDASEVCGRRIPNAWGLFDMHGNVWEWCWDKFDTNRNSRVLRGGSFDLDYPQDLRSADRSHSSPVNRNYDSGFRISRTP